MNIDLREPSCRSRPFRTLLVIFMAGLVLALAVHPPIPTIRGQLPQPLIGVWAPIPASPIINDTTIPVGATVRFDLNITGSPEILAFDVKVVYDFNVLEFTGYDFTGTALDGWSLIVGATPPELRLRGFGAVSWPGGDGTLIHLDFRVQKQGVTPVALSETLVGQVGVGSVPADLSGVGYFTNTAMLGPVVGFSFTPSQPSRGEEVVFDASASFDPVDSVTSQPGIARYTWFFGDGTGVEVTELVIRHIFGGELNPRAGTFWVRLIVTDNDGNIGLKILKVTVADIERHDIRIFRLVVEPSIVQPGQGVAVRIEVDNPGAFHENFTLTLAITDAVLSTWEDSVGVRLSKAFDFEIQTAGLSSGSYEVAAEVKIAPAVGTLLKDDPLVRYVDSNNNNVWDLGESVAYDTNNDGQYSEGEPVLAAATPLVGTPLKDDPKVRYIDSNDNSVWNSGEFVTYDSDSDGIYDAREPIITPEDVNPLNNRQTQLFTIRTLQASLLPFLLGGSAVVVAATGGLFIARRLRSRSTAQHQQEV